MYLRVEASLDTVRPYRFPMHLEQLRCAEIRSPDVLAPLGLLH